MTAALNCSQKASVFTGEVHCCPNVGDTRDLGDERRLFVERGIEDLARHIVSTVADEEDTATEASLEVGFRTRYEIRRKFAPLVSLKWVSEQEQGVAVPGQSDLEGFRLGLGVRLIY